MMGFGNAAASAGQSAPELFMGWVDPWVGLGWIGSHKMDPWTTLICTSLQTDNHTNKSHSIFTGPTNSVKALKA